MLKNFNEQIMKFEITENKLKMEISIKDLIWLFENSPNNTYDGETVACKVKRDKKKEFVEFIAENLMDDSENDSGNPIWGVAFEEVFNRIIEGDGDDFCKYQDED